MYNIEQKLRKNTSIDRHQLAKLHTPLKCVQDTFLFLWQQKNYVLLQVQ